MTLKKQIHKKDRCRMSKFTIITSFTETILDDKDNAVNYYDVNLPHHAFIVKEACKCWNDMHMERFYDGILKDKVESAKMSAYRDGSGKGKCLAKIEIVLKPGIRMTAKYRLAISQQTSAQMSDGWGEGFFGYINIMTDGKSRFIAE